MKEYDIGPKEASVITKEIYNIAKSKYPEDHIITSDELAEVYYDLIIPPRATHWQLAGHAMKTGAIVYCLYWAITVLVGI